MTTQTFEAQVINAQAINDDELELVLGGFGMLLANPLFTNGIIQGFNTAVVEQIRDQ